MTLRRILPRRSALVKPIAMIISTALIIGLTHLAVLFNKNWSRKTVRVTIRTDQGR